MDRSTIVLALLFVGLTAYAAVAHWTTPDRYRRKALDPTISLEFLPDLDTETAERLEIWEPDIAAQRNGEEGARKTIALRKTTRLEKDDEGEEQAKVEWVVDSCAGYPAKQEKVTELLEMFTGFKGGDIRSRNPDSHGTLQVDESGKEIKIHAGDALVAHFYVGKMAGGMRGTFVRREGAEEVVLVPGQVPAKLSTFKNNWLDNQLVKFEYQLAKTIEIESTTHGTTRFEKDVDSGEWKVTAPEEFVADARQVDSILRPVAVLRFLDVVASLSDQTEEHGLHAPRVRMKVELSDDTSITLIGGANKDERAAYATVKGNEFVFEISKYTLEKLDRSAQDYRPKEKKPATPVEKPGG